MMTGKQFLRYGALVPLVSAGVANAATDVTAIAAAGVDIAAVGAAVFAIYVAIKLVKWVRRAL